VTASALAQSCNWSLAVKMTPMCDLLFDGKCSQLIFATFSKTMHLDKNWQ